MSLSKIVVDLAGVTKTFGPTKALDNVSLSAFEGEIHAIIKDHLIEIII